MRCYLQVQCRS